MSDARRARAERRAALAACVAQTGPIGGPPHRSPSPAANAATGPVGNEQQASLLHQEFIYLALSDVGFWQTLKVPTLGCARSLSLLPIYALAR